MGARRNLQLLVLALLVVAAMLLPSVGRATGGRYAFAGGTPRQQAEVARALAASSFDWDIVPATVTIHIGRGVLPRATPGEIWLDADLLDAGPVAWGVVQHEYAHQVDFLLLTPAARAQLRASWVRLSGAHRPTVAAISSGASGSRPRWPGRSGPRQTTACVRRVRGRPGRPASASSSPA